MPLAVELLEIFNIGTYQIVHSDSEKERKINIDSVIALLQFDCKYFVFIDPP